MLLHFQDPAKLRTKKVDFEVTYYARDGGTLEQLKDLTTKRRAWEESINGCTNITTAIAREMAGGATSPILQELQKLEKYIPLLENLVRNVVPRKEKQQLMQWTSELNIRWTSSLCGSSGYKLTGQKYFRFNDLRFELVMALSLYAALLQERALELLTTDDFALSAMHFRKAAGVYSHISDYLLPELEPFLSVDRPPELTSSMASIMSLLSLAEAQAVHALKAEQKQTSGALLAKIHYGVVEFLQEVLQLLQTKLGDWIDVSDKLKRFVAACSVLHEAKCRRYIAEEFKKCDRLGMAAGILRVVSRKGQLNKPPSDPRSKLVFKNEMALLNEMLRKCEHENDFIWRERAPLPEEMPVLEGKKIVTAVPYAPSGIGRELNFVA